MSMCRCPSVVHADRSFPLAAAVLQALMAVDRGWQPSVRSSHCCRSASASSSTHCLHIHVQMGKRRTGRPGYKPIEGAEKRIHRRLKENSTTEWTRSTAGGKATEYDSLCHRYVREVGPFLRDDDASVAAAAAASVNAVAASGAAASSARGTSRRRHSR